MFYKFLIYTFLLNSAAGIQASQAVRIKVPDEFPGHESKAILGYLTIPDHFSPEEYLQTKAKGEGACNFNSLLAGLMHSNYGRKKIQGLIKSQNDNYIEIGFYFPPTHWLKEYNGASHNISTFLENALEEATQDLSNITDPTQRASLQRYIDTTTLEFNQLLRLQRKVEELPETTVEVSKKFVKRRDLPSFPRKNSPWINILQQAYMKITKNRLLWPFFNSDYSCDEIIDENDRFRAVPLCKLTTKNHSEYVPNALNIISTDSHEVLEFFPLVDIPLKSIDILINQDGLNLEAIEDAKKEVQDDGTILVTSLKYDNILDFVRTHQLSKDLLMQSNVIQLGIHGHAVALFFEEGKVYYYDNVFYKPQFEIYGTAGPVYEEAFYFKGKALNVMEKSEFFTLLFKEIAHRAAQVSKVRDMESPTCVHISFFESPLKEKS